MSSPKREGGIRKDRGPSVRKMGGFPQVRLRQTCQRRMYDAVYHARGRAGGPPPDLAREPRKLLRSDGDCHRTYRACGGRRLRPEEGRMGAKGRSGLQPSGEGR